MKYRRLKKGEKVLEGDEFFCSCGRWHVSENWHDGVQASDYRYRRPIVSKRRRTASNKRRRATAKRRSTRA